MAFDEFGYDEDGEFSQRDSDTGEFKDLPEPTEDQERLQELWDAQRDEDNYEFLIYRTEDDYWWAITLEPRHFNDNGEYLGFGAVDAEKTLRDWLR